MKKGKCGLGIFLTFCWVVACDRPAGAAPWPRFRGPNGTGVASGEHIPVKWSEKSGLLWKVELPGAGNSSPVVWGDHLFLQTATPDGKERLLLCLNPANGKVRWSQPVPGNKASINPRNSLASSTPATDGERVYVVFWDGSQIALTAYDFQGHLVWQHPLGGFVSQHGAGASPIVCEGKVLLANDQDGSSVLVCLDAKTGKLAWQAPRKAYRACYSTPFLREHPGEVPEVLVTSTAGITSYHPHTGHQNWHWTWTFDKKPLRTVSSPVAADDLIFANSGDGDGSRHTVAIRIEGKGDVSKSNPIWQEKRTFPYVPGMLILGEHLYWVNDRGVAGCTVAKTGATLWTKRLGQDVIASPVLIDGKVYSVDEAGNVFVFAAAPEFKLLDKNALGEPVIASPAVADGRLFIRGKTHLFCIGNGPAK
jgi:outer membrane protein assembly factor BamB